MVTNSDFSLAATLVKNKLLIAGRKPLFLTISGSHACGLERPDSDIDVRGVYLDPTVRILGLHPGRDTIEGTDGIVDYQLYEFGKFLRMLNNHNGNIVRMLLGPLAQYCDPSIDWMGLGAKFLTKQLRFYYRGYAESQRKRAMSQRGGKALIYTFREVMEGLSLMRLGYPIFDFVESWNFARKNGFYDKGLLDIYFGEPDKAVTDEGWRQFYAEWECLCQHLDREANNSSLPDSVDIFDELNDVLVKVRLQQLREG